MADMLPDIVNKTLTASLLAGEQVSVRILNSDGTVKTILYEESVPTGKTCTSNISVTNYLTDAV